MLIWFVLYYPYPINIADIIIAVSIQLLFLYNLSIITIIFILFFTHMWSILYYPYLITIIDIIAVYIQLLFL